MHAVAAVFPCVFYMSCKLSIDPYREMTPSAEIVKLPLKNRIQFLNTEDFLKTVQKFKRQLFGKRMGRPSGLYPSRIPRICAADILSHPLR